jgi:hypothetical protein
MEGDEGMRRMALLLMVMASTLLVVSGVAWAVTKTCPPTPKKCLGTKGADVLKSSSRNNWMYGKGGNDTYTHFAWNNSGHDAIVDSGGKDTLDLSNFCDFDVKYRWFDTNKNGKADALGIYLNKTLNEPPKNTVLIYNAYDDTKRKAPLPHGRGWIEDIPVQRGCQPVVP